MNVRGRQGFEPGESPRDDRKTAVIIGAGPAGLTAASELLARSDVKPVILEMSRDIGGISKTINYKGNRMDIGGHRFFSKSDTVMDWWQKVLPPQGAPACDEMDLNPQYRHLPRFDPDPEKTDRVMLKRRRLSRIFYLRRFFDYPISLSKGTLTNLGATRVARIGASYLRRAMAPIKEEKSLEDFFINRFGDELYRLFFRDYTEKVWGVKPSAIKPAWGAQRIKGLSVKTVLAHAVKGMFKKNGDISQKNVETSLIEQFLYPKLGPGQLWEEVARRVQEQGGEIHMERRVTGIDLENGRIVSVRARDEATGREEVVTGDWFISTMPVRDLAAAMGEAVPPRARQAAQGLVYRDFITVGLLLKKLKPRNDTRFKTVGGIIPDVWIYVQERDVKLGRIQIFNNWSPYLVQDRDKVWVGLEYFCTEGDELWSMSEEDFAALAVQELDRIGFADPADVLDRTVVKIPKAYPAYFGTYDDFSDVREFTDSIENLFLVGRNGQHRYNNMDHSMLTAMAAVDAILGGGGGKDAIWAVNSEQEYHEKK